MKPLLSLVAVLAASASFAAEGPWMTHYAAAVKKAKAQNKALLLDFTGSDWCGPCIRLKKTVYDTPEFAAWAKKNVILVELDFPRRKIQSDKLMKQNEGLAVKYQVDGFPTVLIIDANGKPKGRLGYTPRMTPAQFIGEANQALAKKS